MIRKLNRLFQSYAREKRLKIGKFIWDRKEKKEIIQGNNFLKDNNIKSILFLRYDGKIGDMVINTIMFREIKKYYPDIKIGVVSRGGATDIIVNNKNVDKIYKYEKNRKKIKELAKEIETEKYDLLIDFSEMLRVNEMMFINLCHAKFNMGLDRQNWQLFDISINSDKDFKWTEHITKRYSAYLIKLGLKKEQIDIKYDVCVGQNKKYEEFFQSIKQEKTVVINPYAASRHKSFSLETLKKIRDLFKEKNTAVILLYFGDKKSELKELENEYTYLPPDIKDIKDSIYIISRADLVISPDTSIVHIASALEKKLVCVYPPNGGRFGVDHLVWAPLGENIKILFCKDKESKYSEIDINTFDFEKMKTEIKNLSNVKN